MQELRQSTEIKVRVGSAVDATDGVTPETTLALGTADQAELLKHNGVATVDISSNTFAAITAVDGWYDLTLTTTDTNTLGQLTVVIQDSSLMAPIFRDFMVVTANYWDSKYSTDKLEVDLTQIGGVAQSATDLKDFADTGYNPTTHYLLGVTTCTTTTTNTDLVSAAAVVNEWESQSQVDPTGFHVNVKEVNGTPQTANDNSADINSILGDTEDLQIQVGTAGAGLSDLGGMSHAMKTEINDEVVDVVKTDTTSEPSQGDPPATPTMEQMQAYLYFKLRNKGETTASEDAMYNDAGDTKVMKSTISDNGTTFTKSEYVSGA